MPRMGAEKGGRGRRRPRPILGGTSCSVPLEEEIKSLHHQAHGGL